MTLAWSTGKRMACALTIRRIESRFTSATCTGTTGSDSASLGLEEQPVIVNTNHTDKNVCATVRVAQTFLSVLVLNALTNCLGMDQMLPVNVCTFAIATR